MTVSRRLRFEILTRDNHTCRYCGRSAPEVKLTVDHVAPIALGGTDEPTNLATACDDCNGGKSASTPGAPLVADVTADAERWSAAMSEVARRRALSREDAQKLANAFRGLWESNASKRHDDWCRHRSEADCAFALPPDWIYTLQDMRAAGLRADDLQEAFDHTFSRDFYVRSRWRYFCGTAWGLLKAHHKEAAELLANEPPHNWRNSMDGS